MQAIKHLPAASRECFCCWLIDDRPCAWHGAARTSHLSFGAATRRWPSLSAATSVWCTRCAPRPKQTWCSRASWVSAVCDLQPAARSAAAESSCRHRLWAPSWRSACSDSLPCIDCSFPSMASHLKSILAAQHAPFRLHACSAVITPSGHSNTQARPGQQQSISARLLPLLLPCQAQRQRVRQLAADPQALRH